ncbi:MAG: TIGR02300 family protein [Sphingomicrobium sp.]
MVKPEWGHKRTCPKCSTRFYDLGKDEPVTCIACGAAFVPDAVLKSKQPMAFEAAATPEKIKENEDLAAEDLVPDEDEEPSADDEVDLTTSEDDLGVATGGEDEEH